MHRRLLQVFQSTHPLRGATAQITAYLQSLKDISIHAPLAGCDARCSYIHPQTSISIHAPLAGCDYLMPEFPAEDAIFQSTHPLRGATRSRPRTCSGFWHFNPRTPCGVRHTARSFTTANTHFNPRTPCGVRPSETDMATFSFYFNPRTPCGVRPVLLVDRHAVRLISIHAPLAGCDYLMPEFPAEDVIFQSTHPLRGATRTPCGVRPVACISIHAPLAGCDSIFPRRCRPAAEFQSTHPLRGATNPVNHKAVVRLISIHAPLAGCDSIFWL